MRVLLTYSTLLAAAVVLLPIDGSAQGRGPGAGAQERAQVERSQTDRDRDRARDHDRMHQPATMPAHEGMQARQHKQAQQQKQVEEHKRIHVPRKGNGPDSDIYGHELMSVEERNRYRDQLRLLESDPEKKARFEAQHREQMQARAKLQGLVIDDGGEVEEAE